MISIDSVLVEEFRGIRKLELALDGRCFAVCGSNGTGKSGVVDAIEFVLTGNISRLSGEGTDKLSVKAHAPHVDSRNDPAKAQVRLAGTIPSLGTKVTITRTVAQTKSPTVVPADPDVFSVLRQIEEHPEVVLTRREIIRYILATEGNRAQEVQAVLKLDRLEEVRATLKSIANAKAKESEIAAQSAATAKDWLLKALGVPKLGEAELLEAVNSRRQLLGLPPLAALESTTSLKDGMSAVQSEGVQPKLKVSKQIAKQELSDLQSALEGVLQERMEPAAKEALSLLQVLDKDPDASRALAKGEFLESGLQLVDAASCPFCDTVWEPEALRAHVAAKIKSLEALRERNTKAEKLLQPMIGRLEILATAAEAVRKYCGPAGQSEQEPAVDAFKVEVGQAVQALRRPQFAPKISALENPPLPSMHAKECIDAIQSYVCGLPEASKEEAARDYLTLCESRLNDYREARRKQKLAWISTDHRLPNRGPMYRARVPA